MEFAEILNYRLGLTHHITHEHVSQLTQVFGDVQLLVALLGMPDNSVNDVLRSNTSLNAMQIVEMRCWYNNAVACSLSSAT